MIVLGVDGMDPKLLARFMADGDTPNLKRLAATSGLVPLATAVPPQSPVAWSDFITGMDAGGHGIFDFVAFDRQTLSPYLSIARVEPPARQPLAVGRWRIPLGTERTVLLRHGQAFWELLDRQGIPTTMFQVPANYPPVEAGEQSLAISGMGTPDLRGTAGTFSVYTNDPKIKPGSVSGGEIRRVKISGGVIRDVLQGPPNSLLAGAPFATTPLTVRADPVNPVALLELGGQRVLLNAGEWSGWLPVSFDLLPAGMAAVPGMVRVLLKQAAPYVTLYVSPVNIDPRNPAQTIGAPPEWAPELAARVGPFYTEEMPEDTKALTAGIFTPREFITQSGLVLEERRKILRSELDRFQRTPGPNFLFFYLSTVDQRNHMLARETAATGAARDAVLAEALRQTYREVDMMVGWILAALESDAERRTAFLVMSDHGFANWHTQAHLNAWLEQNGYLVLKDPGSTPAQRERDEWLTGIDWQRTRAFGIGLNSLYLNVQGRERDGIVPTAEREALAREIVAKLGTWRDPDTGALVVTQPLVREDIYHGPRVTEAPDVLVGYAAGYRSSWGSSTGKVSALLLEPNTEPWSGDHCMDSRAVPGILLANRPLQADAAPTLRDLPVTILQFFGIQSPPEMTGKPVFSP